MAILSAFTLIRAVSLLHLTAAYIFFTAPKMIADQNVVFVLGEATGLSHAAIDKPTEATAFLALILTFLGISDLTAANMTEEIGLHYWLTNVPVRLAFLFVVTGYIYVFKAGGLLGSSSVSKAGTGELLQNSMVFSWGFFELAAWFWIFTKLREERQQLGMRQLEKLRAEQEREQEYL